jgi:hypothetical protein
MTHKAGALAERRVFRGNGVWRSRTGMEGQIFNVGMDPEDLAADDTTQQ